MSVIELDNGETYLAIEPNMVSPTEEIRDPARDARDYRGGGTPLEAGAAPGMGNIYNMGAEIGATTSVFPYNLRRSDYLIATLRENIANLSHQYKDVLLAADPGCEYDQIIEIYLATLEPPVNGPFTPDLRTPTSKLGEVVKERGWPLEVKDGLIGSCTNRSYEDMSRVTSLIQLCQNKGVKTTSKFYITPRTCF